MRELPPVPEPSEEIEFFRRYPVARLAAVCASLGIVDGSEYDFSRAPVDARSLVQARRQNNSAGGGLIETALFTLGGPIAREDLLLHLLPRAIEPLLRASLMRHGPRGYTFPFTILPFGGKILLGDRAPLDTIGVVYRPGAESTALARAMDLTPCEAALDLCCGAGGHAILLSEIARRVTAIDVLPRAAAMTRFNAWLNHADNIEALAGDLFEPLPADARFDAIVGNPPFIATPRQEHVWRDGGPRGDALLARILEALDHRLTHAPVARAQLNCEVGVGWQMRENIERLASRAGKGFAARFEVLAIGSPESRATGLEEMHAGCEDHADRVLDRLESYEKQGFAAFLFGVMTLRRAATPALEIAFPPVAPGRETLAEAFSRLEAARDEADFRRLIDAYARERWFPAPRRKAPFE